ncbi:hypothetical protein FGIG_03846 [Fasciola gigantica]|uniref:Uncharacterized protein n=1 Tax=Fasciola gigantica TaxID=46835 RepID=A0A504YM41_FASGI|nr:hypothetical protein FGIG_03846 [Fasciola gigantica]
MSGTGQAVSGRQSAILRFAAPRPVWVSAAACGSRLVVVFARGRALARSLAPAAAVPFPGRQPTSRPLLGRRLAVVLHYRPRLPLPPLFLCPSLFFVALLAPPGVPRLPRRRPPSVCPSRVCVFAFGRHLPVYPSGVHPRGPGVLALSGRGPAFPRRRLTPASRAAWCPCRTPGRPGLPPACFVAFFCIFFLVPCLFSLCSGAFSCCWRPQLSWFGSVFPGRSLWPTVWRAPVGRRSSFAGPRSLHPAASSPACRPLVARSLPPCGLSSLLCPFLVPGLCPPLTLRPVDLSRSSALWLAFLSPWRCFARPRAALRLRTLGGCRVVSLSVGAGLTFRPFDACPRAAPLPCFSLLSVGLRPHPVACPLFWAPPSPPLAGWLESAARPFIAAHGLRCHPVSSAALARWRGSLGLCRPAVPFLLSSLLRSRVSLRSLPLFFRAPPAGAPVIRFPIPPRPASPLVPLPRPRAPRFPAASPPCSAVSCPARLSDSVAAPCLSGSCFLSPRPRFPVRAVAPASPWSSLSVPRGAPFWSLGVSGPASASLFSAGSLFALPVCPSVFFLPRAPPSGLLRSSPCRAAWSVPLPRRPPPSCRPPFVPSHSPPPYSFRWRALLSRFRLPCPHRLEVCSSFSAAPCDQPARLAALRPLLAPPPPSPVLLLTGRSPCGTPSLGSFRAFPPSLALPRLAFPFSLVLCPRGAPRSQSSVVRLASPALPSSASPVPACPFRVRLRRPRHPSASAPALLFRPPSLTWVCPVALAFASLPPPLPLFPCSCTGAFGRRSFLSPRLGPVRRLARAPPFLGWLRLGALARRHGASLSLPTCGSRCRLFLLF